MKMKEHSFHTVVLKGRNREKKKVTVAFADDSYDIVSEFINGEMESFHQEIYEELNRMKEEGTQARFSGNRISFAADPERTLIYEDGETEMRWREITTDEFLQLIDEWEQEKRKSEKMSEE